MGLHRTEWEPRLHDVVPRARGSGTDHVATGGAAAEGLTVAPGGLGRGERVKRDSYAATSPGRPASPLRQS